MAIGKVFVQEVITSNHDRRILVLYLKFYNSKIFYYFLSRILH